MKYLVLAENDESKYDDKTGKSYHYPFKYRNAISTGDKVIYYKGKLKNKDFRNKRLSEDPHYFGTAEVGKISSHPDNNSLVAEIDNYVSFEIALPFKDTNGHLEDIPESKKSNYWRDGVRIISEENFLKILSKATKSSNIYKESNDSYEDFHSTQIKEGNKVKYYTHKYERSKINRDLAIKIHGYNCKVCDFNFGEKFGDLGEGFIHVHHINPLFNLEEEAIINPKEDLVPVCPNCHSMIHRYKNKIISIEELKRILKTNSFKND